MGISGGEFDPRWHDPEGIYILEDGTELTASEFGNYLAGYGSYYHMGLIGSTINYAVGDVYAVIDKTLGPIYRGDDWWEAVTNPPEGTLLDGPESTSMILRGAIDATWKRHDEATGSPPFITEEEFWRQGP